MRQLKLLVVVVLLCLGTLAQAQVMYIESASYSSFGSDTHDVTQAIISLCRAANDDHDANNGAFQGNTQFVVSNDALGAVPNGMIPRILKVKFNCYPEVPEVDHPADGGLLESSVNEGNVMDLRCDVQQNERYNPMGLSKAKVACAFLTTALGVSTYWLYSMPDEPEIRIVPRWYALWQQFQSA